MNMEENGGLVPGETENIPLNAELPENDMEAFQKKSDAFIGEIEALAKNYGVHLLAAVSFIDEKRMATVFVSPVESDLLIEMGLAKLVENKFRN